MKHFSIWKPVAIGVCISGAFFAACSSGSSDNGGGPGGGGSGGGSGSGSGSGGTGDDGGACVLNVAFAPSYSAYESSHQYQVPFIVTNGTMTGTGAVTWTSSDPSVQLAAATDQLGTALEMATMQGAPASPVTITATDPTGACTPGTSTLTITATTADLWQQGNERYNNGVVITRPDGGGFHFDGGFGEGGFPLIDASDYDASGYACTNCHGDNTNPAAPYKDVKHTPEQTGGFSDQDLQNIFLNGIIPDGGYFDPSVICGDASTCTFQKAYGRWQSIHNWTMTTDEANGLVAYLRSLPPEGQTGSSNFGGHQHQDGGGHPPHDSGPAPDANDTTDATVSNDASGE